MRKQLILPGKIVTANQTGDILSDHGVEIINGIIHSIMPVPNIKFDEFDGDIIDEPNLIMIPGFIQTHVHLCQALFRGMADDLELLDWLKKRIFPLENSHDKDSLRISADIALHELQRTGTTTVLDMGTMNHQEIIFEQLAYAGQRALAGKCMIDRNDLYPEFKESSEDSFKSSLEYAAAFHNSFNGKIKYAFAPRFVLSCTEELLLKTKEAVKDFDGALFHTHSSENKNEVETVRRLTGKENIEYFDSIGVLDDHTVLAHCIHVNEQETQTLKRTGARVAHCPSSNLKLGSGIADVPKYLKNGISVSIASDGAPCNNNMSMFTEMRLAALMQKPVYGPTAMNAETVFRLATIEGAKALHLDKEIGSIEVGKKADLVLLNLEKADQGLNDSPGNIYSSIVYSASKENVNSVMIEGEWVVRKNSSLIYDEDELVSRGKMELQKVIQRAGL